jgi:hypothetical protein
MSTMERALSGAAIEVTAKATWRRFILNYKRKIVREADGCKTPGAVGTPLRREGLYSSHLTTRRAARELGALAEPTAVMKRGPARRESPIRATSGSPDRDSKKHRGVAVDAGGHRALLIATVTDVGLRLGSARTCAALGVARATYYRGPRPQNAPPRRRPSPRPLSDTERMAVLAVLHESRFEDLALAEVYATLLDEGRHLCSERTMYRVLAAQHEVRERRNQLRHPRYAAPELLARRPKRTLELRHHEAEARR